MLFSGRALRAIQVHEQSATVSVYLFLLSRSLLSLSEEREQAGRDRVVGMADSRSRSSCSSEEEGQDARVRAPYLKNGSVSNHSQAAAGAEEEGASQPPPMVFSDDDDEGSDGYKPGGYHAVRLGDTFKNGRYVVVKKLGWGHFSTVWMARDDGKGVGSDGVTPAPKYVALKVQKSAEHYTEAARDEVDLLQTVSRQMTALSRPEEEGQDGKGLEVWPGGHVVRLLDCFDHVGPNGTHVCMVFEMLGCNLLSVIKRYNYHGIPISIVKYMARQICHGLDFLHRHCKIIHTDLKPENILLDLPPAPPSASEQQAAEAAAACANPPHTIEELSSVLANADMNGLSAEDRRRLRKKLKKKKQKEKKKGGDDEEEEEEEADGVPQLASPEAAIKAEQSRETHSAESALAKASLVQGGTNVANPAPEDEDAFTYMLKQLALVEVPVAEWVEPPDDVKSCLVVISSAEKLSCALLGKLRSPGSKWVFRLGGGFHADGSSADSTRCETVFNVEPIQVAISEELAAEAQKAAMSALCNNFVERGEEEAMSSNSAKPISWRLEYNALQSDMVMGYLEMHVPGLKFVVANISEGIAEPLQILAKSEVSAASAFTVYCSAVFSPCASAVASHLPSAALPVSAEEAPTDGLVGH